MSEGERSALKLGRYALVRKLGRGGMATVYLGRTIGAEGFRKPVSVKVIHPHLMENQEARRSFIREAKLAARLAHPNIAQVLDFGEDNGQYVMVLEYVHGYDLGVIVQYLGETGRSMRLEHATYLVHELLRGLEQAHGLCDEKGDLLGVVHCDINPHNVLVGVNGQVKLTDFGVAQVREEITRHTPHDIRGTLAYQSPEQVAEGRADARSDLFALGIIYYELITGARLFRERSEAETVMAVFQAAVPDVRSSRPELPGSVNAVLAGALARSPESRYQSAAEFAWALRELLGTAPPEALEPSFRAMIANLVVDPSFLAVAPARVNPDTLMDTEPIEESAAELDLPTELPEPRAPGARRSLLLLVALGLALLLTLSLGAYGVLWLERSGSNERERRAEGGSSGAPEPLGGAVVSRAFRARQQEVRDCILRHGAALDDERLIVAVTVDGDGQVREAAVEPPRYEGTPLGRCLITQARALRFPPHPSPRETFRIPITIRAAAR